MVVCVYAHRDSVLTLLCYRHDLAVFFTRARVLKAVGRHSGGGTSLSTCGLLSHLTSLIDSDLFDAAVNDWAHNPD